jgi:gamma-glutamyltranspeptidase/glutathione hydrolase/leukotriene-C4 hydrolase
MVEAMKHAFALRANMGDPGPNESLVPSLPELLADALSETFNARLRNAILDNAVLNVTEYGGKWNLARSGVPPTDGGTTHISIVDSNGTAVALTSTINTGFGSKVLSQSTGILLNNQMDDFSIPDQTNIYGLPSSSSNFIRPGKKPLSSMSPLILEHKGHLYGVIGASGGPRIISSVAQTLLRVLGYGEGLFEAVAGPRLHHQLVPNVLYAEDWAAGPAAFRYDEGTLSALAAVGQVVRPTEWGAVVQAILAESGVNGKQSTAWTGVSDPRKDGAPAGH